MFRHAGKTTILVAALLILYIKFFPLPSSITSSLPSWSSSRFSSENVILQVDDTSKQHPIEQIVTDAQDRFAELLESQSDSLDKAIAKYQSRYQREPPPGFGEWFKLAVENECLIIDDYDNIAAALDPYWRLSAKELRDRTSAVADTEDWLGVYTLKDHKISKSWHNKNAPGLDMMEEWIKAFVEYLPDMQIPYNILAEPRVPVSYDELQNGTPACKEKTREEVGEAKKADFKFLNLSRERLWPVAKMSCSPKSPARQGETATEATAEDFRYVPENVTIDFDGNRLSIIQDVPASKDMCKHPEVQNQHGTLISPDTALLSQTLMPVFSRNKYLTFQDILVPTPAYDHGDHGTLDEDKVTWADKKNDLYWSGTTTGGFSHDGVWRYGQRFRFVGLVNNAKRKVPLMRQVKINVWEVYQGTISNIAHLINVKFTKQKLCTEDDCAAQKADPHLRFADPEDHLEHTNHRLVIDVDGQASTDRYYKLLASKSAVLKQTMFSEWHDDRLIPWVHFIPISMGMEELAEVVRWLAEEEKGQVAAAQIATQGREWITKGLRPIDIRLYVFRLLLEWGRLIDPARDEALPDCKGGRDDYFEVLD